LALGTGLQKKPDCYGTHVPHEKKFCLILPSSVCAKRSGRRSSEAIEDSHDKRRYNLLRCARSAREEGHQKQLKIQMIKEDTTFFGVREALGKKVMKSN